MNPESLMCVKDSGYKIRGSGEDVSACDFELVLTRPSLGFGEAFGFNVNDLRSLIRVKEFDAIGSFHLFLLVASD